MDFSVSWSLVKKVRSEPDALTSGTLWEALVLGLGSSPQPTLKG